MSTTDEPSPLLFPPAFREVVSAELTSAGLIVIAWEHNGVNVRAVAGQVQHIGLIDQYRRAANADPSEWPAMIRGFLARRSTTESREIPNDLATIAKQLRPRLGRPCDRTDKTPLWGIPLPGIGLEINLVVDFPDGMVYVTEPMIARSRQSGEDLLDIALENLRAATPGDYFERACDEQEIYMGHLGDAYDATRALLVEELMPDSPAGFWVAIPSREELIVWPVSFAALGRVHAMKLFAEDNYREHAYPISDEVFWVWRGMWYHFGLTLKDDDWLIDAPEPFGEALQELQREV